MTIIIQRGVPERRGGAQVTRRSTSPMRGGAYERPASVATEPRRQSAGYHLAGLRAEGRDHLGHLGRETSYRTARTNFSEGISAPRNRILGQARIKPLQKSLRSVGQTFHFRASFVATASCLQGATGADAGCAKKLSNRGTKS